jgi:hypothetical protein
MTEREENPRKGTNSPVMFVGGLVMRGFGAVSFFGGLVLVVAGIVNFVHFHDRAGGTTGIVLGYFFMLAGSYLWTRPWPTSPLGGESEARNCPKPVTDGATWANTG